MRKGFLADRFSKLPGWRGRAPTPIEVSLRWVITGAEKLPERIALAYEDHFGIRPLQGYGCTECSPVVAVNVHDFRVANFCQVGFKRGSIGHPLSEIAVRIVDQDTLQLLPLAKRG